MPVPASRADSAKAKSTAAKKPPERRSANGSQSVHRAFTVLRAVSAANAEGSRLGEIAKRAELHVATAHRLLGALIRERFVAFDPYSRRYHIGHEFVALGSAARESRLVKHYRAVLERIANTSEDTVYLSAISNSDAVCLDRVEGRFPIRTLTLDVGARRPLGVGGGSLALLAALPAERIEALLAINKERYTHYNDMSADEVRGLVRKTKQQEFAFNDGRVIPGVSAVSLPVLDRHGNPIVAISVAAISQRMKADRRREIAALIKSEVANVPVPSGE